MKKLITICLFMTASFIVKGQSKQEVFSSIQKLLIKASGQKVQSNNVFAKKDDKLGKQVFTENEVTVNTIPEGKSKYEWINRATEIKWNEFLDYLIYTEFKNSNLQIVKLNFKKWCKTEYFTNDKMSDDNPSTSSSFEFYVLTSDKKEMEQLLTRLYDLKEKKADSQFNKEIEKLNKQQTITWLKEKLSDNIAGDTYTTSIKLISLDDCNLVYEYTNFVGRKYQETMPTSIESISNYNRLIYSKKICISKAFAFGIIQEKDEITYSNISFLSIKSNDEDLISNIEFALKHLANFCNSTEGIEKKSQEFLNTMVFIEGGTFTMGSDDVYEKPAHKVTVSSFYIGKYEITQAQWQSVMSNNPSSKDCSSCPVEMVSWDDINIFLQKINLKTGKNFRLPTEAEWEYAARGGNKSRGFTYSGSNDQQEAGWSYLNSGSQIQAVGLKKANELGLYDMSGNVFEWCKDWKSDYSNSPSTNPQGPSSGTYRVMRGGSWRGSASNCRVSYRNARSPADREDILGFRVVVSE